jgi:hypothetical protein
VVGETQKGVGPTCERLGFGSADGVYPVEDRTRNGSVELVYERLGLIGASPSFSSWVLPPKGSKLVAEAIPGARLLIIPGMGHDLPNDLWPRFAKEIADLAFSDRDLKRTRHNHPRTGDARGYARHVVPFQGGDHLGLP